MDQSSQLQGLRAPLRTAFGVQPNVAAPTEPQPSMAVASQSEEISQPEAAPQPPEAKSEPVAAATEQTPPQPTPQPDAQQPQQTAYPGQFEEELLYDWKAPSRPFKKRKRQYFMTVITIGILLSLILFFAGQLLPIAVVFAVVFLAYVMAVVPPHEINFYLTTYGIRIEEELYYWEELGRFWFTDIYGQRVVHVELDRFPFKLSMVLGKEASEQEITEIMSVVLYHEQPKPTLYEQIAEWLQKKFPLDLDA